MATLRSMILNEKLKGIRDLAPREVEIEMGAYRWTREQLESRDTILVNATSVARSVEEGAFVDLKSNALIPRPKPPFHSMWLEAHWSKSHTGALVLRKDTPTQEALEAWLEAKFPGAHAPDYAHTEVWQQIDRIYQARPASIVMMEFFYAVAGGASFAGETLCWLNPEGDCQPGAFGFCWPPSRDNPERQGVFTRALAAAQFWGLLTMARLNCHNVELKPVSGQGKREGWNKTPASVWHEIVVKPSPLTRRMRRDNPAEAEQHAVRLHKVRGHFADYRKGAGLFGKYKVLIWVDEHEAGDADLGTVVGSYRIE